MSYIDPHVHCRDWGQAYKATIKSVRDLARRQGVAAVFDMPNTDPPLTSAEIIERRLALAESEGCREGYYIWGGATGKKEQTREMAHLAKIHPRVIGIKMYAGRSVGDLTVSKEEVQKAVYRELAECGYRGVIAVHCEKEGEFRSDMWNPERPSTWELARPKEAEISSIEDQIQFAREAGFEGTLHIAHISTPEGVEMVKEAKSKIHITCAATPHHLTLSWGDMDGKGGLRYKVNPPLRNPATMRALRERLLQGDIDWIETDHAPHTDQEKFSPPYLSGIPSLERYAEFISSLKGELSEGEIENLTYWNIKRVFPKVKE